MSIVPFVFWGVSILSGFVIYVSVATVIEKSGLKRLGATGNLFTCDPKEDDKQEKGDME